MPSIASVGLAAVGLAASVQTPPRLVYNGSRSVPVGWYVARQTGNYGYDDLVLATPPESFGRIIARRGYLPPDVPLIKRVAALPGDRVCYRDGALTVLREGEDRPSATVRPRALDRAGRVMPVWNECRKMGPSEVFLLLEDTDASLDSRYFGPVSVGSIEGKLHRLAWP